MTVRGYTLGVLWSRGGDYTSTLEDATSYVAKDPPVVASWGRTEPRATSDAASGKLTFTLNNHGRQFSPENTTSPIAGKQLPGTPVRLTVVDPATAVTTTIYKAPIDHLAVDGSVTNKAFSVDCLDGWSRPGAQKLSTDVYAGKRTGDLVNVILDAIGWPDNAGDRSVDSGVTVVPYWWAEGVDAQTAVQDLVHSEGPPACAWVQNGTFYFRDRHHRVTLTPSLTSQATYTHTIPAGPVSGNHKVLKNTFVYDHGLDNIVNSATFEVSQWIPGLPRVVWSTDDVIQLDANASLTLVISTDTPFVNLQTPDDAFDSNANGVLESDYHVAIGSVSSMVLSRTSGQSAFLTITAGVGGLTLDTGIKVRGTPLEQSAARKLSASNAISQNTYGDSDWDVAAPWAHYYDAQAVADRVVAVYSTPNPSVTFEVDGRLSAATMTRILNTQVSDRITVDNDEIGVTADFFVEQVTHTVQQLGARHRLQIGAQICEPYQADNPFQFGVSGSGFDQGEFVMDTGLNPATMFRFDTAGKGFGQGAFAL